MVAPLVAGGLAMGAAYGLSKLMGGAPQVNPYKPDKDKFKYGGTNEGEWQQKGAAAGARAAPKAGYSQYGMDQDRANAGMARQTQNDAVNAYRELLKNPQNSVAQQQLKQGTDANVNNMMSVARSGSGDNSGAQRQALFGGMQAGAQMNQQAGVLRAQETQAATKGLADAAMQQRTQDLQSMGLDANMAQFQAQMELNQGALNDKYSLGLYGLGQNASMADLNAGMGLEQLKGQQSLGAQTANAQAAASEQGALYGMMGTAGAAGMKYSDENVKEELNPGAALKKIRPAPARYEMPEAETDPGRKAITSDAAARYKGLSRGIEALGPDEYEEKYQRANTDGVNRETKASAMVQEDRAWKGDEQASRMEGLNLPYVRDTENRAPKEGSWEWYQKTHPSLSNGVPDWQESDKRVKEVEGENSVLRTMLERVSGRQTMKTGAMQRPPDALDRQKSGVHDEASAAKYGAEWTMANSRATEIERARQLDEADRVAAAQGELGVAERKRAMLESHQAQRADEDLVPSDERVKQPNLEALDEAYKRHQRGPDLIEQAAAIPTRTWRYKPGFGGPETQQSPYAQDLERVPATRNTVKEGPDGVKQVDTSQLALTTSSMVGELARKVQALEGKAGTKGARSDLTPDERPEPKMKTGAKKAAGKIGLERLRSRVQPGEEQPGEFIPREVSSGRGSDMNLDEDPDETGRQRSSWANRVLRSRGGAPMSADEESDFRQTYGGIAARSARGEAAPMMTNPDGSVYVMTPEESAAHAKEESFRKRMEEKWLKKRSRDRSEGVAL